MQALRDRHRRTLDADVRYSIVAPDDIGSEHPSIIGSQRFRLRLGARWISTKTNRMSNPARFTRDPAQALQFSTRLEALSYLRHVDPIAAIEDDLIVRPLLAFPLVIEEVGE